DCRGRLELLLEAKCSIGNRQSKTCSYVSSTFRCTEELPRCGQTILSCASLPGKPFCRHRSLPPQCWFGEPLLRALYSLPHRPSRRPGYKLRKLCWLPECKVHRPARELIRNTRRRVRLAAEQPRATCRCPCGLRRRGHRAAPDRILGQKAEQ